MILNDGRLDRLGDRREVGVLGKRAHDGAHDAGAGDAHVDDHVGLADAVYGAGHERVVLDHVAEDDELRAADAVAVGGGRGRRLDRLGHAHDRVHVDARARGGDVDRRADALGCGERRRDRVDERCRPPPDALLHERREAADEVDADLAGGAVHRLGDRREVVARARPATMPAIGVTEMRLLTIGMPYSRSIASQTGTSRSARVRDAVVHATAHRRMRVGGRALGDRDAERHRADVEVLLGDHGERLDDLLGRDAEAWRPSGLHAVHEAEDVLALQRDLHAELLGDRRRGAPARPRRLCASSSTVTSIVIEKMPDEDRLADVLDVHARCSASAVETAATMPTRSSPSTDRIGSGLHRAPPKAVSNVATQAILDAPAQQVRGCGDGGRRRRGDPDTSRFRLGDVVRLKKPHPCGANEWEVTSSGWISDSRASGCDRKVRLERYDFDRRFRGFERRGGGRHVRESLGPGQPLELARHGDLVELHVHVVAAVFRVPAKLDVDLVGHLPHAGDARDPACHTVADRDTHVVDVDEHDVDLAAIRRAGCGSRSPRTCRRACTRAPERPCR